MNRRYTSAALLVCLLGLSDIRASGLGLDGTDTEARAVVSVSISPITIDGVLDERAWEAAPSIGEVRQREPHPGEPATETTEVKILYDRHNLYIGVMCFDSDPKHIVASQMSRDADLSVDDRIEILIDSFRDRRNAFYFATNPLGAFVDALIIENGEIKTEWDAIWLVRTRRTDQGWSAEIAIPFKSLGFHRGQRTWGFNISRTIKRKLEEDRWASPRLDLDFAQVSEAGEITGFDDIEQGKGLDVRPYLANASLRNGTGKYDANTDVGADIFYNITPSLKSTTTINTDFAETEVDTRQINLTRFPLFFPEKRAFFLESAGSFDFLNSGEGEDADIIPFYSRRIGLLRGLEVPIAGGTKLTGKVGGFDLGLLAMRSRATDRVTAQDFGVLRVKRNVLKQSYIGGIFTIGDPAGTAVPSASRGAAPSAAPSTIAPLAEGTQTCESCGNAAGQAPSSGGAYASRTFGGDFRLFTSDFLGRDQNFGIDGFLLETRDTGSARNNRSFGLAARYPNDLWNLGVDWKQIEGNFRPALGFVPRTDVRKLNVTAEFNPRPEDFLGVRQMFHEVIFTQYTNLTYDQVESWRLFTAPIKYDFNSGEHFEFNFAPEFERLFEPFEIVDGVTLPIGDYRFNRWCLQINTASKRRWKLDHEAWFGSFWSGTATEFDTTFEYKITPHLQTGVELKQTFASLKEGDFVATLAIVSANYSVSPLLTFYNLIQFDNQDRRLGWQSRVRWTTRPGNDMFFVVSQGWLDDGVRGLRFDPSATKLAGKLQYTFRF